MMNKDDNSSSSPGRTNKSVFCALLLLTTAALLFVEVERNFNLEPQLFDKERIETDSPLAEPHWCQTADEYSNGRWVYYDDDSSTSSNNVGYPYWSDPDPVWGPRCTQLQQKYQESGENKELLPDFLRYKWHPNSNCEMALQHGRTWDKSRFCQQLAGKTIGVSGDSLSQQFVHSLMGFSRGSVEEHTKFVIPTNWGDDIPGHWVKLRIPLCSSHDSDVIGTENNNSATSDDVTLIYQRWDKYQGGQKDRAALTELIQESDYLILNWGVHYQTWSDMERATDDLVSVLEAHWRPPHKQPERLFWRSTNVAHASCSMATEPLGMTRNQTDSTRGRNGAINPTSVIHHLYHTEEILMQDEHIVRPRLRAKLPQMTFLRVEESTLQRPDGHRVEGFKGQEDCLHYCEPGPIDHWAELFYHYVVALKT